MLILLSMDANFCNILFYIFFNIYLFGCLRSSLHHADLSSQHADSPLVAHGLSGCDPWA